MLDNILEALLRMFPQADRGFVGLQLELAQPLAPAAVRFRDAQATSAIQVSRSIINQVLQAREGIIWTDAASDSPRFSSDSLADAHIHSVMCAPLIDMTSNVIGVVQIDSQRSGRAFRSEDLRLLVDLASQAAFAIKVGQLHQQSLKQAELERDLDLAARVQASLLPGEPPKIDGYEFFARYQPAQQLSGDCFDYVLLSDGRVAVAIADVAGKGIAAALVMAELMGELKCLLANEQADTVLRLLNLSVGRRSEDARFVTMALAILNPATHEVSVVNAGHWPPLWRHADGKVEAIGEQTSGLPLGVDDGQAYAEFTCRLGPGDSLILFTDGFTEAMNCDGELYGAKRLRAALPHTARSAPEIGGRILEDVGRFVGDREQADDMCLVCFGRLHC